MDSLWDFPDFDEHELVHFVTDRKTNLKAVIALHSTHLGPGAGGTRFWHYAQASDAIADALRLSRGMSYKNAMAGLPLGGGKAVILARRSRKTPEMLRAFARPSTACGHYVTAEDVDDRRDMVAISGRPLCRRPALGGRRSAAIPPAYQLRRLLGARRR